MTAPSRTADEIIADWHAGRADHDPYDEIGGLVAEVRRLRIELDHARAEWHRHNERADNLRTELAATEGDLGVAIREAARARGALRKARDWVAVAACTNARVYAAKMDTLRIVDAALDQRLTQ